MANLTTSATDTPALANLVDELGNALDDYTGQFALEAYVLDHGLSTLADEADMITLCDILPDTYTEATSTYMLGSKDFGSPGGAFGAIGDGIPTGRVVSTTAVNGGTVDSPGLAAFWAAVDTANSRLLCKGDVDVVRRVVAGDTWSLPSFSITIPN